MITLDGLTHKQKMLAQLIWDCETQDQLETLIRCLPTKEDRYMASTLSHVMIYEALEQNIEQYRLQAQEVIDHVR
jgi:membrane-anchored glycerophosphoryl diester phosphodiesterase (GDPDase)